MKRLEIIWHAVLILAFTLAVSLLSFNIVLRLPETYLFHFNDTQAPGQMRTSVSGQDLAHAITSYFNRPGGEDFQVYEQNGSYQDPLFSEEEALAMRRAKQVMTVSLAGGLASVGLTLFAYFYLYAKGDRARLRATGKIAALMGGSSIGILLAVLNRSPWRHDLYQRWIGVDLKEDANLLLLLGSPFERVVSVFTALITLLAIGLFLYFHLRKTKEKRIFF